MKKRKRLDLVSMVVKEHDIHTKAEIVDYIEQHFGIRYSLATISRDLNELKIYKMPAEHQQRCYRQYNENAQKEAKERLIKLYQEDIVSLIIKDTYLIIKTSPGFAQTVNYYIDQLDLKEVIGTVGGNDTILVITQSNELSKFVHYKLFGQTYEASHVAR
ncbi:arginine repressor [Staphylococcus cornubiensis]|uniref:arginine repressor n=1 Tax=Staphylococcus cornubiensis TaxID=1986155 RepID=UPI000A3B217A|nr:ArgR family transcriptional regulator [Staphylococcus cornubiensis]